MYDPSQLVVDALMHASHLGSIHAARLRLILSPKNLTIQHATAAAAAIARTSSAAATLAAAARALSLAAGLGARESSGRKCWRRASKTAAGLKVQLQLLPKLHLYNCSCRCTTA